MVDIASDDLYNFSLRMTIAAFIKLLTCVESLLLGVWTVKRDPESRRSILFAGYLFLVAAQSFVEFQMCTAVTVTQFVFWKHFDVFVFLAIAVMFHFAVEYSGFVSARIRGFLVAIYFILFVVTIMDATLGVAPGAVWGPWGFVSDHDDVSRAVYSSAVLIGSLLAVGTILLFVRRLVSANEKRTKIQSAVMLGCMAVLVLVGAGIEIALMLGIHVPFALSAVSAFLVINPVLAASMFRYDILDITPKTAASDILETMTDGLVLTDTPGVVRYVNPAMARMFGLPIAEIVGKKLHELPLRSASNSNEEKPSAAIPFERELTDFEGTIASPTQKWIPVSISSAPFVRRSNPAGFIVTLRDVSQRKQMEDIKENVEKMMRHDLKNALCGILGFSELMGDADNLTEFQRHTMQVINKSGQMMLRQIEGYLALQRMESGVFSVEGLPADLVELARDVQKNLEKTASSRGVPIVITMNGTAVDDSAGLGHSTQPALFFSMLMNLAKNAVEASPRGRPVQIDLASKTDTLLVTIHNFGAIPNEIRGRFFGKFVTAQKKNGTGLGAYSAKRIAESLGGRISVHSDDTSGTTVTIAFARS